MTSGVSPTYNVVLYFLAIFVPPLAVFFKRGFAADFWINICLTILAWIPGIIHAWWVISKQERASGAADPLLGPSVATAPNYATATTPAVGAAGATAPAATAPATTAKTY